MTVTELPMAMQSTVYQASEQIQVTATRTTKISYTTQAGDCHWRARKFTSQGYPHESGQSLRLVTPFRRVASHSQTYDPFQESGQSFTDL